MKNLPTLQAFLFFVANSDPAIALHHMSGFNGCAIGLFTQFTKGKELTGEALGIEAEAVWQALRIEASNSDNYDAKSFTYAIADAGEDYAGAWKTMGDLQLAIDGSYPKLEAPKVTDLTTLRVAMAIRFPDIWIKDGSEFSEDHTDKLWTGEGSQVLVHFPEISDEYVIDVPAFDMHGGDMYEFGVYKPVADFLEQHGYYASAYDAGTFFIYEL